MLNVTLGRIAVAFSLLLMTSAPLWAADTPQTLDQAQARIELLEKQVQALRAQIAMLQSDLADARAAAKPAADAPAANDGNLALEAEADAADADEPDNTQAERSTRVYRSAITILSELPPSARPHPSTGWSQVARANAYQWLNEKPIGATFKRRVKVTSVQVQRNVFAKQNDRRTWIVDLRLEKEEGNYLGTTITAQVGTINNTIRLTGDDAFAERAKNVKAGSLAEITGKIKKMSFIGSRDIDLTITLEDVSARVPGLTR